MKVLVIGNGGREHALCWKIKQSRLLTGLYCAPGNPGTASLAENVSIGSDQINELAKFAKDNLIALTIVGPELPLSLGIVDVFNELKLPIFGPTKDAAMIEASKCFAKDIMLKAGVKTAAAANFNSPGELRQFVSEHGFPTVLKADGLAAGKGVVVCNDSEELSSAIHFLFNELKASNVLVEEFLTGVEASFIVATDGKNIVPMATAHDYKRLSDHNLGPNTGGMGTCSPTPRLTSQQSELVLKNIIEPTLAELERRGCPFKGFLYAGLMIQPSGDIYVIEFNARMGDPECQSILCRARFDLLQLIAGLSAVPGIDLPNVAFAKEQALCVVMASKGYPDKPKKGDLIDGIAQAEKNENCNIFHAGTDFDSHGCLVTNGGRVLNVVALGPSLKDARVHAYNAVEQITYDGAHFRRDIGE